MRIGVDSGGTKIEAIALEPQGATPFRHRVATPKGNYQQTMSAVTELVRLVEAKTGQQGSSGIGIPGSLSRLSQRVKNANSVWLNGQPHNGSNGNAGEWGHNPLPWMDEDEVRFSQEVPCYCSKAGCIETFVSGTGFATDYHRLSGIGQQGPTIVGLVENQDPLAELPHQP